MITFFKLYTSLTGDAERDDERIELLESLNDLFNQGYEVKAQSDWTTEKPVTLLLHKKGPMVETFKRCPQCGGRHDPTQACPFPTEIVPASWSQDGFDSQPVAP